MTLHWLIFGFFCIQLGKCHQAKDFDDSVLYKIDFEMPDFEQHPELVKQIRPFYTHEKEKYECVIPILGDSRVQKNSNELEASPYTLLQPILTSHSCSYRIEAYWSYEICHGQQVRQYHEEREGGKTVKLQVYYLGKWNEEKSQQLVKDWDMQRSAGKKYKTTKIEGTQYPYFEIEMSDGTLCDIINAPRTTIVRYVCYPHGKNEIYSFKETSSCQYEAIILTSVLCVIPAFHPEDSKEVSIKCFNSPTDDVHKPLSMLKQELSELQYSDDFPAPKNLESLTGNGDRYLFLNKFGGEDVDKLVMEFMTGVGIDVDTSGDQVKAEIVDRNAKNTLKMFVTDLSHFKEFISGKNCLIGGTGWWKYEFCYGRHVRQFHKDKKSETELYLGFFNEAAHRTWASEHPDKVKRNGNALWHHYEKGTFCERTGHARKVDVKLHCTPLGSSVTAVSMYLLEPKTCQYILVVESQIVCDLLKVADDDGLIEDVKLQELLTQNNAAKENMLKDPIGATGTVSDALPLENVLA